MYTGGLKGVKLSGAVRDTQIKLGYVLQSDYSYSTLVGPISVQINLRV